MKTITFDFDTNDTCFDMLILLEDYLYKFTNEYGIISIFDSIDDDTYGALSLLMDRVIDNGRLCIRDLANKILACEWELTY